MGRIRWVFAGLALLLLLPTAVLVQRALAGVARERDADRRTVAERLFDEMERELSDVLRAEEERPVEFYRFEEAAAGARSAGAVTGGLPPYVVDYFELDPDGGFRVPSRRGAPAPSGAREASVPGPSRAAEERLADLVQSNLEAGAAGGKAEGAAAKNAPRDEAAGARAFAESDDAAAALPTAPATAADAVAEPAEQSSAYQVLQALNKGAQARRDRKVKLSAPATPEPEAALRQAADAYADARPGRAPAPESARGVELERRVASVRPDTPAAEPEPGIGFARPAPAPADAPPAGGDRDARGLDAAEILEKVAPTAGSVEIHPMVGRLIDDDRLLLHRQVFVGGRRYRQGLVVDVPKLFRSLDAAVVGASGLAGFVQRDYFTAAQPPRPAPEERQHYRHRFAEPFDALGVELTLGPLPNVRGEGPLYAIAGLLLLSVTGGLLAVYRMVAVRVGFAERRSNFVAAVSHELKTPLTAIRMYGEMLRDGMVSDEAKRAEYYGTITAESERLTRLIDNVLEFSRLEQGSRETHLVVGDVGSVVRAVAGILAPHARELGFRIEVEVASPLPPVRFDRDAVHQIVFNLVDNALKYARDSGDRSIALRCVRDGDGVCIAVRDRGPGVPARHLAHIFEPFYRGEDELTRRTKGTGIGLALVRGLAETMGAAVSGRNLAEGGFEVSLRFRTAAGA